MCRPVALIFKFNLDNQSMVGLPGLEPGTSSLSVTRSDQLSYKPEYFGYCTEQKPRCTTVINQKRLLKRDAFLLKNWVVQSTSVVCYSTILGLQVGIRLSVLTTIYEIDLAIK